MRILKLALALILIPMLAVVIFAPVLMLLSKFCKREWRASDIASFHKNTPGLLARNLEVRVKVEKLEHFGERRLL
jgi:hypothetical protein